MLVRVWTTPRAPRGGIIVPDGTDAAAAPCRVCPLSLAGALPIKIAAKGRDFGLPEARRGDRPTGFTAEPARRAAEHAIDDEYGLRSRSGARGRVASSVRTSKDWVPIHAAPSIRAAGSPHRVSIAKRRRLARHCRKPTSSGPVRRSARSAGTAALGGSLGRQHRSRDQPHIVPNLRRAHPRVIIANPASRGTAPAWQPPAPAGAGRRARRLVTIFRSCDRGRRPRRADLTVHLVASA